MKNTNRLHCILLVDDDSITNFINTKVIEKLNFADNIKIALNGQEALNYIEKFCSMETKCCPELILLDLNMPVMNGFEFLENFKELSFESKNNVKIVILTTSTHSKDMDTIKSLGITTFVNKPLTEEKIRNCLQL